MHPFLWDPFTNVTVFSTVFRRNVHRHQGHGKNWSMWQYEAERAEGRNYTHSKTTLVLLGTMMWSALKYYSF